MKEKTITETIVVKSPSDCPFRYLDGGHYTCSVSGLDCWEDCPLKKMRVIVTREGMQH